MANPICLSPLKFYDSVEKQNHRKSYAYGHISPLIVKSCFLPPFQIVVSSIDTYTVSLCMADAFGKDVSEVDISEKIIGLGGLSLHTVDTHNVLMYMGIKPIYEAQVEGLYYLKISQGDKIYISEIFECSNNVDDCIEITYWNSKNDLYIKNGIFTFANSFKQKLYLRSELGKPTYNFEEEATVRYGYSFVESQVSKKTYRFNAVIPEYLCDALRIIRLCNNKILKSKGEVYEMLSFEMDVEWQEQGDLASVTCEFDVDNIIVNFGANSEERGSLGDFNDDFNNDFNK